MQFLITLLSVSLVMSCIMLSLFLLSSFTIRKTSAKTRYMMWIVLLIGLIIPFRPILGKGLITLNSPSVNPPIEERIQAEIVVEETARPELSADNSASEFSLAETSAQQEEVSASSSSANSTSRSFFDAFFSIYTLILIWAIGAIAVFSRYMLQYQNFRRMIRRWGEKVREAETLLLFEEVKAYMGLGNKRIDLAVCPFITTPMLTGIFKPVVLLPQRVFSEDELELIFEHELTHYKHKDLLVNFLTVVTLAVHWFNPLLYIFVPSVYNDGESYCDETVLFGKDNNYRRFYGEVIISMIDTNVKRPIALSTCFYTKKINLKRRLFHIMESSKRKKQYSMVGIALALGLTLASGSVFVFASPSRNDIGLQKAKMIALKNAGLYAANVSFVNARLDKDGATRVYEIEFFSNGMEYDYTIDAISGAILNKDSDIDNFSIPQNNKTSQGSAPVNTSGISLEKAKEIALKNAGLNSSNVSFVKAKLDSDDGRKVYDIEFYSNNVEYDYEIDATSGAILDKDTDIESFSTSQNNEVVQGSNSSNISGVAQPIRSSDTSGVAQTSASSNNSGTAQTSASSNTSGVSLDKSKPVSVNQAGLTGSQVQTTKSTSGNEGGRSNYNIELRNNDKVDVSSGKVREQETEKIKSRDNDKNDDRDKAKNSNDSTKVKETKNDDSTKVKETKNDDSTKVKESKNDDSNKVKDDKDDDKDDDNDDEDGDDDNEDDNDDD